MAERRRTTGNALYPPVANGFQPSAAKTIQILVWTCSLFRTGIDGAQTTGLSGGARMQAQRQTLGHLSGDDRLADRRVEDPDRNVLPGLTGNRCLDDLHVR